MIYGHTCPDCAEKYIWKIESTLHNRTREHAWSQKDSAIHKHSHKCDGWRHIKGLVSLGGEEIDIQAFERTAVREMTKVIRRAGHWQTLAFKEALAIKDRKLSLNKGMKAATCKQLVLRWTSKPKFQTGKKLVFMNESSVLGISMIDLILYSDWAPARLFITGKEDKIKRRYYTWRFDCNGCEWNWLDSST